MPRPTCHGGHGRRAEGTHEGCPYARGTGTHACAVLPAQPEPASSLRSGQALSLPKGVAVLRRRQSKTAAPGVARPSWPCSSAGGSRTAPTPRPRTGGMPARRPHPQPPRRSPDAPASLIGGFFWRRESIFRRAGTDRTGAAARGGTVLDMRRQERITGVPSLHSGQALRPELRTQHDSGTVARPK